MATVHPVVGSWRVVVTVPPAGVVGTNLATLGVDGTVVVAFPTPVPASTGQGHNLEHFTAALGSWVATGEHGAAMVFVSLATDEHGNPLGAHTVSADVAVEPTTESWGGPFRIDVTGPKGEAKGGFSGTVAATRIVARPGASGG